MAKKKEIKPIPIGAAIAMVLIGVALLAVFLVYMFGESGSGDIQDDVSLEQSFGDGSSIEPPPVNVEVKETMADAKVGDAVIFGKYEQNGKTDSTEPIEWIVLEKQSDKLLLISRYALDTMAYDSNGKYTEWNQSTLYNKLNGEFLNGAFSEDEVSKLLPFGDDESEKVSILSVEEAGKYYEYDSWRISAATEYAVSNGARIEDNACWWWLRDKGNIADSASYVHFNGTIQQKGFAVDYSSVAVRPIIWVSADAETETEEISSVLSETVSEAQ